MIEFTTIVTLCILYLIFFRPGKTPPLENPLVIERAGQYHMTLAPQLNLAQPFVEDVAGRLDSLASSDCDTVYFEVRDKQVTAHGFDFYLLAVSRRHGMLFFQAARPVSKDANHLEAIREFSRNAMARFPEEGVQQPCEEIVSSVNEAAQVRGIEIRVL